MDPTPAFLVVVTRNKKRYAIPVNSAGIQVGPPSLFRNPNRRKRGGYGPGTVDGSSPSRTPPLVASDSEDGSLSRTSRRTAPHRKRRSRNDPTVCFTDAPTTDMSYGDLRQPTTTMVPTATALQPSILLKSGGLLQALPSLFDFEYEPPHTSRQSPEEPESSALATMANDKIDGKDAEATQQMRSHACCLGPLPATPVPPHVSCSSHQAHHSLHFNSDPALHLVKNGHIGDVTAISRRVHQIKPTLGAAPLAGPNEAPTTPQRSPAAELTKTANSVSHLPTGSSLPINAPSLKVVTLHRRCSALCRNDRSTTPEETSRYPTLPEKATSRLNHGDASTSGVQKGCKHFEILPRTQNEGDPQTQHTQHTQHCAVKNNATHTALNFVLSALITCCERSSDKVTPRLGEDAAKDDCKNANHPPIGSAEAMDILIGDYLKYEKSTSFSPSDARGSSRLGSLVQARSSAAADSGVEDGGPSASCNSQPKPMKEKVAPRLLQSTEVADRKSEQVLPWPTHMSDADCKYVRSSTLSSPHLGATLSSLSRESLSSALHSRGHNSVVCAAPPGSVPNSLGMWRSPSPSHLMQHFSCSEQLHPLPVITKEASTEILGTVRNPHPMPIAPLSPISEETRHPSWTASLKGKSCLSSKGPRSTMIVLKEGRSGERVKTATLDTPRLGGTSEKSLLPAQSPTSLQDEKQWEWMSIRGRLMQPVLPVSPNTKEQRLPSVLHWPLQHKKGKGKNKNDPG